MQSLELSISNHNKQQEKCGELQKISLKCIPLSARLVSLGTQGCLVAALLLLCPEGGFCCGGTQLQLAIITAPRGCSQQHKERLAGAPGGGFHCDHEVTTSSAGGSVQASQGHHLPRAVHPAVWFEV